MNASVFGNTVCSLVSGYVVFVVCGSPAFSLKYCMLIGSITPIGGGGDSGVPTIFDIQIHKTD